MQFKKPGATLISLTRNRSIDLNRLILAKHGLMTLLTTSVPSIAHEHENWWFETQVFEQVALKINSLHLLTRPVSTIKETLNTTMAEIKASNDTVREGGSVASTNFE